MMTVAWLVGWLAGWLAGRSVGWLVGVCGWVGRWMDGMIEVLKSSWALSLSSGHMNPTFHSRVSRLLQQKIVRFVAHFGPCP